MKTMTPAIQPSSLKAALLRTFAAFEKSVSATDKPFVRRLRNTAIARFDEQAFPGPKSEEWRFTPLQSLLQQQFELATRDSLPRLEKAQLPYSLPGTIRLVFIDGFFAPELSECSQLPAGCTLTSLRSAIDKQPGLVESALGRHVQIEANFFAALNTAFLQDGCFLHLAANCKVERPIHLLFLESGRGLLNVPRILVLAESHSQATLIENYATLGEKPDLTIPVSEFVLSPEARIDHYRVNDVAKTAYHFATQHVAQKQGSHFRSQAITLGGGLVRNDLTAVLNATGCECTLNGLYTVDNNRLVDNHTTIDHAMPHCNSHELYKGIITDKGKGVFNGKIFVRQDAQKTDAKQTNQTLLLSPDATIDSKPQLEIFADDVKCTHGATVGQLDEEMLFYLRSRGIGKDQANAMLMYAFANDILERIEVAPLREMLEQRFLTSPSGSQS